MAKKPMPVRIVNDVPRETRQEDSRRVSIRQIKNGFIVNEHGHKNGRYYDEEYYAPTVNIPSAGKAPGKAPDNSSSRGREARLGRSKL